MVIYACIDRVSQNNNYKLNMWFILHVKFRLIKTIQNLSTARKPRVIPTSMHSSVLKSKTSIKKKILKQIVPKKYLQRVGTLFQFD